MFDINKPERPYDSGYIWLPIEFQDDKMSIAWQSEWDLNL